MRLTLDEALALAEEARANGHLNKFPQACIALADEILRLRKELQDEDSSGVRILREGS